MVKYADCVSIIMPVYNAANTLADALISVTAQSFQSWELIIVNDCSHDASAAIALSFSKREPRIKLVNLQVNVGPAAARNEGLLIAKGRWVAFLDSDDLWLPDKLEKTINHASANFSAVTFTGFRRISDDGLRVGRYISVPSTVSYKELLGNTVIVTSTSLIDRNLVGSFLMQDVFYDDFVCWLSILKRGFKASGLDQDLTRYRVRGGSISRNKIRSAVEVWRIYRKIEGLGFTVSVLHFSRYIRNSIFKYSRF